MGVNSEKCKSLDQAKHLADSIVSGNQRPKDIIKLAILFLGIPLQYEEVILRKWQDSGFPPVSAYAPYLTYVLTVELYFQIALAAGLISSERPSNRVDIAYLFYLPFFNDNLFRQISFIGLAVPIF